MKVIKVLEKDKGCLLEMDSGIIELTAFSETIIRCRYNKGKEILDQSVIQIEKPVDQNMACCIKEKKNNILFQSQRLQVVIDKSDGTFCWNDCNTQTPLLQEGEKVLDESEVELYTTGDETPIIRRINTVDGERSMIENLHSEVIRTAYSAKLFYEFDEDEKIYGFGQGEDGVYNYRGKTQYLYQHNMRTPMPFFLSNKNYGIFINCGSSMIFHDDIEESYMLLDTVDQLEYFFIIGNDFDEIINNYRSLVGTAAMLPKWAFGYVQSKERYRNQEELVDVVQRYRELNVPIDCIVQDWHTWGNGLWGDKNLDQERYSEIEEACQKIHDMNVHVMVSIWPNMNVGGSDHLELQRNGFLLNDFSTYNAFDQRARKMYWDQANKGLFSKGFDAWWCDCTEPFSSPDWCGETLRTQEERYALVSAEHKKYIDSEKENMYALVHAKGIYENQRADEPDKRVLNLTRSGYSGIQKYGVVLWSGDISATWKVLKKQITEGLNCSMSGIPFWTLDIGGFFTIKDKWQNRGCLQNTNPDPLWFWCGDYNEGVKDYGYRELYTRWLQFAVFLPVFRSHGTDTPREIWNFGRSGDMFYDAIEKFIKLRYRLMPYIYSLAGRVTQKNYTMLRSLLFDYGKDPKACELDNEYMFGDYLLICPVTQPMYYEVDSKVLISDKKWKCYLPNGNEWYNFWTNEKFGGGQDVLVDTPIDKIPIFVKSGAILVMEEQLAYAMEQVETPLHIYIYRGQNASFCFYEDDGSSYQYEQGKFNEISMEWIEELSEFCIGEAKKNIPGSIVGRNIIVHVENEKRQITYGGEVLKIGFKKNDTSVR